MSTTISAVLADMVAKIEAITPTLDPDTPFRHYNESERLKVFIAKKLPSDRLFQIEFDEVQELGPTNVAEIVEFARFTVYLGIEVKPLKLDTEARAVNDRRQIRNALVGSSTTTYTVAPAGNLWPAPLRGDSAFLLAMTFTAQFDEPSWGT